MGKSLKERLASAKLAEKSLQVCLRGDLAAEFEDLERRLADLRQANDPSGRRVGSKPEAVRVAEQMAALREQMLDEMLDVRVRALPRAEWVALTRKHPPKKGDKADEAMGVDLEAFMAEAMPQCIVEPEMDADDWARLNEVLSSGDFDRLFTAVWDVNRSGVDVPKSRLASLVMTEAGAGSK